MCVDQLVSTVCLSNVLGNTLIGWEGRVIGDAYHMKSTVVW